MPVYDYKCKNCGHTFDKVLSISKRNQPESQPCPSCGKHEVGIAVGLSSIVSGVSLKDKRPDGFREVLKNIKKAHPNGGMQV